MGQHPLGCLFLWGGGDLPEGGLRGAWGHSTQKQRKFLCLFYEIRLHRVPWHSPELQKKVTNSTTTKNKAVLLREIFGIDGQSTGLFHNRLFHSTKPGENVKKASSLPVTVISS